MHICFISHEYPLWATGGIGTFIQTLGRTMVKKGHRVTVVGIGHSKVEEKIIDEGVELYRLPAPRFLNKGTFLENVIQIRRKIKLIHKENAIDIVESPEWGLAFLPHKTPYKKVVRMHGGHHFFAESENRKINKWKGFQEKLSFRKADGFIAVSSYVKKHTAKYLSYHSKPISVISNPLNKELFYPDSKIQYVPYQLVFAGTVCEKKGIRQLIEAIPLIANKFPKVHLLVYGRDWFFPDGKSYIKLLKKSFSDEVLQRVSFMGPIPANDMPLVFRKAHLCVFPSHMETLGLVAPEAMLTGRPVLFTNKGPGPEIIEHGLTGFLCNPLDPSDIAEKVTTAFRDNKKLEEIALNGYNDAVTKFDEQRILIENLEFYAKLM